MRAASGRGAILQFPVFFFLSFLLFSAAAAEEEEGRKCILRQCKKQSKFNDACPSFLFFPPFASSESQSAKRGKEKFLYFSEDIMEEGKKVFFFPPSAAAGKIDLSNFFLFPGFFFRILCRKPLRAYPEQNRKRKKESMCNSDHIHTKKTHKEWRRQMSFIDQQ